MTTPFLPYQRDPIAGNLTTPNGWYEFFRSLRDFIEASGLDPGIIDQILARLDELEQNTIGSFAIQGLASIEVNGTPEGGVVQITLLNDNEFPGNTYYYGTGPTGVKGFFTVASALAEGVNIDFTTGLDGVTTISMPAAGDGSAARKPIQYNADALDTLGADTGFTYDPTVGVKLLENEGPASFRAITDTATLGAELTTNGTFTGSATGWTLGAGWAYGVDNVVVTVVGAGTLSQNLAIVSGTPYRVSWSQTHSVSNNATITPSIGAAAGVAASYANTATNTQTQVIMAAATGAIPITFAVSGAVAGTVTIDNVSVQAITNVPFTLELESVAGSTVVEHRALASSSNLAIGSSAGRSNTTGVNNMFLGSAAGLSNLTGNNNAFFGPFAGANNTAGDNNSFLGPSAGRRNTTGNTNTFFGSTSGPFNSTGSNNSYFGGNAGLGSTTGSNNTYLGQLSASNATIGSSNVVIGNSAGRFQADGVTALTNPNNSVYVGVNTRGFSDTDNNTIAVGFNAIGRGPNTAQWGNTSIINHYFSGSIQYVGKVFVTAKSGFPAPVAGVITLANNTNYEVSGFIDLTGDRIVCGTNNAIFGQTADADGLISTGLPGGSALITSTSSLEVRNLRLSAPTGRIFDLNDGATNSLNWSGVQIIDTPTIGTIQNYANIVMNQQIVQNSANLTLDGTIASFVSETALWDGRTGQTTIIVPATAIFTRRFRMLYTAVSVQPGETGINFNVAATIPDESYILDNVSFTGGGTYLSGLDYTSNKSSFFRCFGITNTNAICQYSMTGNATATVIAATGTFVKVAGTTVASALNQKFNTATTNRALYTGAFPADFNVSVTASMRSGNNQNIRMRIAKNGTTIAESNSSFITTGAGDASAVPAQTLTSLIPTDYLEIFVANDTAVNNITVSDLNLIIRRLG